MAPALLSLSSNAIEANALEHALDASSIPFALWPRRPRSAKLGYLIDASEAFPTKTTSSYKLSHHRQPAVASFLQEALTLRHSSKVPGGASFLVELPGNKLRASKHTSFTGNACAPLASSAGQLDSCCECCTNEENGGRLSEQGTNLAACKQRCADADTELNRTCDQRQAEGGPYKQCTDQINTDPDANNSGFVTCCACCNNHLPDVAAMSECQKGCWMTSEQALSCPSQSRENDKYNEAFSTAEGEEPDETGSACCRICGERFQNNKDCTEGCKKVASNLSDCQQFNTAQ